ncbi:hypothetical protein RB595_002253 [Gaeumannomyces hyphopodioides]
MQSINNGTHARGPPEQRLAPDARMVSAVAGRDCGPPSSPSPRLYRPFTPTTTTDPSSSRTYPATPGHPPLRSGAAGIVLRASPPHKQRSSSSPSSTRPATTSASATKRGPLPSSFPLFFGAASNQSSASIAPSTAEVRPAPVDGGTAALRELNTNFPSNVYRHISAKSSGAQSKTYSQPVIVRTYNGPYGGGNKNRNNSGSRPVTTRTPLPVSSDLNNGARTAQTPGQILAGKDNTSDGNREDGTTNDSGSKENGVVNDLWTSNNHPPSKPNMPRHHPPAPKKRGFGLVLPWQRGDQSAGDGGSGMHGGVTAAERPKYPPLEAFTMKGIIQAERFQQSELDVSLDQIAELYARSRYSLSNQYEVHVTPHGSGMELAEPGGTAAVGVGRRKAGSTTSTAGGSYNPGSHRSGSVRRYHGHQLIGPTLQATWSEDEADESSVAAASMSTTGVAVRSHRKRRSAGAGGQRRKSAAYGTLETIMSSSRSSSEDKEKKKSASELTEEVRGRAERAAGRKHGKYGEGGSAAAGQQADVPQTTARGIDGRQTSRRDEEGTSDQQAAGSSGSPSRRKGSASFAHAVIDNSRSRHDTTSPRSSASALVSQPALPQTSTGEVESRTTMALGTGRARERSRNTRGAGSGRRQQPQPTQSTQPRDGLEAAAGIIVVGMAALPATPQAARRNSLLKQEPVTAVAATAATAQDPRAGSGSGLLAGLNGWIPWRGTAASQPSQQQQPSAATDGLRDLLKSVNKKTAKGKGVERLG